MRKNMKTDEIKNIIPYATILIVDFIIFPISFFSDTFIRIGYYYGLNIYPLVIPLCSNEVSNKKDKKINLTQEDLDKLCEVYDWYLEIKDCKSLKPKKTKKEIVVDFEKTEDKTVSMKVDKGVWEDFLRLCSNTSHDRKTLVTQALSDFMKVHKDLL